MLSLSILQYVYLGLSFIGFNVNSFVIYCILLKLIPFNLQTCVFSILKSYMHFIGDSGQSNSIHIGNLEPKDWTDGKI